MAIRIDSVLKNAVSGVEQGLSNARQLSSQLSVATPEQDEVTDSKGTNEAEVVRDEEQSLGSLVDVKV